MNEAIEAIVWQIRFHLAESGFTVLIGKLDNGDEFSIAGNFAPVYPGERIRVVGTWKTSAKYGRQFVAESVTPVLPTDVNGIAIYLASGQVRGIRRVLAKRLLDRFGPDLLRVIDEEPHRLREVPGVGEQTYQSIVESWSEQRMVRDGMLFLASLGIRGARAVRIFKHYGSKTPEAIRENPYRIATEVRGISFDVADGIALALGTSSLSSDRLQAGIRQVFADERVAGHCGARTEMVVSRAATLLRVPRDAIVEAMSAAVHAGWIATDSFDGERIVFDAALHRAERRIAAAFATRSRTRPRWHYAIAEGMAAAEEESGFVLDERQLRAIELLFETKAMVLTGGPGVGKTTLVRAFLAALRAAGASTALAAPTGRAAKRLSENTGGVARTIHRLLDTTSDGGFQRNEENPIDEDVVVIDEASMIDVPLMDAVVRALRSEASIVLIGDADQLPSIGPGQVLHDILASGRVPSVSLTQIYRQRAASDIVANAHRIRSGEPPLFVSGSADSDMYFFSARSPAAALQCITELVTDKLPKKFGVRVRDVQVLAPKRKGAVGVDELNRRLREVLSRPATGGAGANRIEGVEFARGDKVMQVENDYDKGVFNGDIGIVAEVNGDAKTFTVDFGGETIVEYPFDDADELSLAYATTIHKAQGSEYPAVVLCLMPEHGKMLRRDLLYTAVTRGAKVVVVVGDRRCVEAAARNGGKGGRLTRLRHLLASSG